MGPQIQLLHSYVTEDKVYCVYLCARRGQLREHARRVGIQPIVLPQYDVMMILLT